MVQYNHITINGLFLAKEKIDEAKSRKKGTGGGPLLEKVTSAAEALFNVLGDRPSMAGLPFSIDNDGKMFVLLGLPSSLTVFQSY